MEQEKRNSRDKNEPSPVGVNLLLSNLSSIESQVRNALKERGMSYSEMTARRLLTDAESVISRYYEEWDIASSTGKPKPKQLGGFNNTKRTITTLKPLLLKLTETRASLAETFAKKYKELFETTGQAVLLAAGVLLESDVFYDGLRNYNPCRLLLAQTVENSLRAIGKVDLLLFSCPEIDANYLTGPDPSAYIKTTASRSTGIITSRSVLEVIRRLTLCGISVKLNIITGFKDEEDYIFPVLGSFGTSPEELQARRGRYLTNFANQCAKTYGPVPEVNIIDWSKENLINVKTPEPPEETIAVEIERMIQFFMPGGYYDGLPLPNQEQFRQIVVLKMQTYATQGTRLKSLFPFTVGLQNEYPGFLRTWMINQLNGQSPIPFIYPFKP